jgi:hypothetical protein
MDYQNRKELVEKLQVLEKKYDVHLWEIHSIQIWPLLKKIIFFDLFHQNNSTARKNKTEPKTLFLKIKKLNSQIIKILSSYFRIFTVKIPKVEIVFSGITSHRINYRGYLVNRYFDPILDYLQKTDHINNILTEYSSLPKQEIYKKERVIDLTVFYHAFARKRNVKQQWDSLIAENKGFRDFLDDLRKHHITKVDSLKNKVTASINKILNWKLLFKWFLKQSTAKATFGLCYYNVQMYGMNLAARELGIPSVDMQHGGQGALHIAYNIGKHPPKAYNLLPSVFWVWDEFSEKQLRLNLDDDNYDIIMGGNPSLEFYNNEEITIEFDPNKPVILITVQPLAEILPEYIYLAIKETSSKYNWWIRLHPRMNAAQKKQLEYELQYYNIAKIVRITEVTNLPLASVLAKTDLHISKFSGTITESAIMNVKSIIMDPIGIESYSELIESDLAFSYIGKDSVSFSKLIEKTLKYHKNPRKLGSTDYGRILGKII